MFIYCVQCIKMFTYVVIKTAFSCMNTLIVQVTLLLNNFEIPIHVNKFDNREIISYVNQNWNFTGESRLQGLHV